MPDFSIVDSHVHLYDPARLAYGWLAGVPKINRRFDLDDYDFARGDVEVDRIVFVEVAVDPGLHIEEARFVRGLADADPRIAGIVAHAPVEKGDRVADDLEALGGIGGVCGIRRLIQDEPDASMCLTPNFLAGVRRVGAAGLIFDICIRHHQLPQAIQLVRRCPDVRFVLDHIGKPDIAHGASEPWASGMRELAALDNVVCKISGVITEADHQRWTPDDLVPYVEHVIDCFGFDRVMFGSDWTVSELTHAYPTWVDILDDILDDCDDDDLRAFYRETALRTYRLT